MPKQELARRDFLKLLGLTGSVGVAGLLKLPMKGQKELLEIASEASAARGGPDVRPFWVKSVSQVTLGMGEMTSDYKRYNPADNVFGSYVKYAGEDTVKKLSQQGDENYAKWLKGNRPGYSIRDRALANAVNLVNMSSGPYGGADTGIQGWKAQPWTDGMRKQHADIGVKYTASPEAAARDVKAAARHFGAAITRVTNIDQRLIFSHHSKGQEIVFEDAETPYSDDKKLVIPNKMKHVVVLASRMSPELAFRAPSALESATANYGYSMMSWTSGMLAEFIRGLGYEAIPLKNDFSMNVAFAALAGVGEIGRTNRIVTPEYGPSIRLSVVLTDLPLAVDGPIDAGIAEFCTRCKKCAENCPSGSLSLDTLPSFKTLGGWNNPGHKAWFPDSVKCLNYWTESTNDCGMCYAACPWTKKDASWMHELVKSTAANTSMFDAFMRQMDEAFGYGLKNSDADQAAWWDLDMPEYGFDSSHGHGRI